MSDRVRPGSNPPFLCPLFNEADRRMDFSGGLFDGGPSFSWLSEHTDALFHIAGFSQERREDSHSVSRLLRTLAREAVNNTSPSPSGLSVVK
jgi:hypothetical protein